MSSTGRGERLGGASDFYATPKWCVDRLLDEWAPRAAGEFLEPAAGDGAIIRAFGYGTWHAVEIREEAMLDLLRIPDHARCSVNVTIGNFLTHVPSHTLSTPRAWKDVLTVITNPPYSNDAGDDLALQFVKRAREACPAAEVVMLLRLAFLASKDRNPFMRSHAPDVYILPDRPSFRGSGGDSADYGWFIWPPNTGNPRLFGKHRVLGTTPLEVRKAQKLEAAARYAARAA